MTGVWVLQVNVKVAPACARVTPVNVLTVYCPAILAVLTPV